MTKTTHKGVEETRNELPRLLEQAASGHTTVITKHGHPIAALVPLEAYASADSQQSLLAYEGSGRGLWGKRSAQTLRKLRDEWTR